MKAPNRVHPGFAKFWGIPVWRGVWRYKKSKVFAEGEKQMGFSPKAEKFGYGGGSGEVKNPKFPVSKSKVFDYRMYGPTPTLSRFSVWWGRGQRGWVRAGMVPNFETSK